MFLNWRTTLGGLRLLAWIFACAAHSLVARPKTKAKYSSQTNLHNLGGAATPLRPRSAPFIQRRTRSSLQFYRPQSADPKFERNFGSSCSHSTYSQENELPSGLKYNRNNKRFQSVSSSNLLKLLLEEPIKRSWLCRGGGVTSPDEQSDLSSRASRKTLSYTNLQQLRMRTNSAGGSSLEGDIPARSTNTPRTECANRQYSISKSSRTFSAIGIMSTSNKDYRTSDYWAHDSSSILTATSKPDLPGRVSFGKPHGHVDIDSSDCDNDKQDPYNTDYQIRIPMEGIDSISAPGPSKFSLPNFTATKKSHDKDPNTAPSTTSSLKKSVHFGAAGGEVLAETYEYPKCPSENCSCSTRSSSTASIHDSFDGKCACEASTCKYARDTGCGPSSSEFNFRGMSSISKPTEVPTTIVSPQEESLVIRDYKQAVGGQLENSVVKGLLAVNKEKSMSPPESLNSVGLNNYLDTYSSPVIHGKSIEKQNNLSESKFSTTFRASAARNLFDKPDEGLTKKVNGSEHNLSSSKATYASSSDTVINNYLKVSGGTPNLNKKKPNKSNGEDNSTKKSKLNGAKATVTAKHKFNENGASGSSKKIQKSISFHSLREDSSLDHFNLDKVDSWMSMHDSLTKTQKLSKHSSIENELEKCGQAASPEDYCALEQEEEQGDSNSQLSLKSEDNSQDDSTYEEIVSVIKEIEDDKRKENLADVAVSEMELKLNATSELADLSQNASDRTEAPESPDKYKDILSYLDNVEDSCDKALLETRRSIPESNRSEIEFVVEPDIVEDVPKLAELLLLPNHQLARRVIALSLRANELANGLHMSKEHVMKLRTEKQKSVRAEKANTTNRLREQKKHYESVVKRHQGFIEQLLKDKGTLCEKVAALTRRLESQNQAWEHKLETEVSRTKETTLAGEKIRRERWVRENTKKIKELTVKGLEMEINKMTAKHQHEITELKRTHQQQLLDALDESRLRHEQIENGIRQSSAQDRESIIEKERGAIRERFERQLEEERKTFDEQKQKLLEDFALERERLQQELKLREVEHHNKRQELQREKEIELEQTIAELQEKMSKQEEKYQNRINTIEKQYEADFEIWKREYENSCKLAQVEKENNIRQHYRAERDRQIDAIVSRMDSEALKNADEYEAKLSRFKEKYEKDIQDAEELEKSLRDKYTETRGRLAESDAQVRNCQAEMKQLQIELEHSKKMCNDFLAERDQTRDNMRNEMQTDLAALRVERDQEIQKIHKRVQQAIEKKDTTIEILQKENGDLRERCIKLEAVIRQQRKDYCIK